MAQLAKVSGALRRAVRSVSGSLVCLDGTRTVPTTMTFIGSVVEAIGRLELLVDWIAFNYGYHALHKSHESSSCFE